MQGKRPTHISPAPRSRRIRCALVEHSGANRFGRSRVLLLRVLRKLVGENTDRERSHEQLCKRVHFCLYVCLFRVVFYFLIRYATHNPAANTATPHNLRTGSVWRGGIQKNPKRVLKKNSKYSVGVKGDELHHFVGVTYVRNGMSNIVQMSTASRLRSAK